MLAGAKTGHAWLDGRLEVNCAGRPSRQRTDRKRDARGRKNRQRGAAQ